MEPVKSDRRNTNLLDWVKIYDDMITDEFCNIFIDLYHKNNKNVSKLKFQWRRCDIYPKIDSHTGLYKTFKHKILEVLNRYKSEMNNSNLHHLKFIEAPNIIRYDHTGNDGNHEFNYHTDNWDMATASRQLSIILYLNDVSEGGETEFPHIGVKVRPKKGRILVFPSFYNYGHIGHRPVSDPKYIIVSWIHFGGTGHKYRVSNLFE